MDVRVLSFSKGTGGGGRRYIPTKLEGHPLSLEVAKVGNLIFSLHSISFTY